MHSWYAWAQVLHYWEPLPWDGAILFWRWPLLGPFYCLRTENKEVSHLCLRASSNPFFLRHAEPNIFSIETGVKPILGPSQQHSRYPPVKQGRIQAHPAQQWGSDFEKPLLGCSECGRMQNHRQWVWSGSCERRDPGVELNEAFILAHSGTS